MNFFFVRQLLRPSAAPPHVIPHPLPRSVAPTCDNHGGNQNHATSSRSLSSSTQSIRRHSRDLLAKPLLVRRTSETATPLPLPHDLGSILLLTTSVRHHRTPELRHHCPNATQCVNPFPSLRVVRKFLNPEQVLVRPNVALRQRSNPRAAQSGAAPSGAATYGAAPLRRRPLWHGSPPVAVPPPSPLHQLRSSGLSRCGGTPPSLRHRSCPPLDNAPCRARNPPDWMATPSWLRCSPPFITFIDPGRSSEMQRRIRSP
jgi:hypothetical protein